MPHRPPPPRRCVWERSSPGVDVLPISTERMAELDISHSLTFASFAPTRGLLRRLLLNDGRELPNHSGWLPDAIRTLVNSLRTKQIHFDLLERRPNMSDEWVFRG